MKLDFDGEFRERWSRRRELAVEIISAALSGCELEGEFERLKHMSMYDRLSSRDQANFRRFCSDVRTVWTGWCELKSSRRAEFLSGQLVYSTLAQMLRNGSA